MTESTQRLPAALIYNPGAGSAGSGDEFLSELRTLLNEAQIDAQLNEAQDDEAIAEATRRAVEQGLPLVIAYGGDGTLEGVANGLVGTPVTLGILPAGTRNNVAAGLNIPTEMAGAVSLLRSGQRRAIDMVHVRSGTQERWFLEIFTAGLLTSMFEDAEAAQKGQLGAIGDLVAKFAGASPSLMHLTLDDDTGSTRELQLETHALLGMNMPYLGANFRVAEDISFEDGYLDLFIYDKLNKLDLLVQGLAIMTEREPDPRIRRLRARKLGLRTDPPMPLLADGVALGEGAATLAVHGGALQVMTGLAQGA